MKLPQAELDRQLASELRALLRGSPAVERPTVRRPLEQWIDGPRDTDPSVKPTG